PILSTANPALNCSDRSMRRCTAPRPRAVLTTLPRAELVMLPDQAPKVQFRQEFRVKDGVMHVRLAGKLPNELLSGAENVFMPLIKLCEESRCQKALIDSRDLEVDLDTLEIFRAGVDASDLTRYGLRIALLTR